MMRTIRTRIIVPAVAVAAMLSMPLPAFAEHLTGSSDWQVTHTSAGKLEDNYSESGMEADIKQLQPGDDLTVTVTLKQENDAESDWYVSNEVLKSLEAGDATGSGYGYVLSYEGPGGEKEIYRSETVGGTGSKGLLEATSSLDDYFYLDTLSKGAKGKMKLVVSLDGETEQNSYFDKFARIRLMFAVENSDGNNGDNGSNGGDNGGNDWGNPRRSASKSRDIVRTGEETNLLPMYVAMMVSGIGLAIVVLWDGRRRKGDEQ